jgi:hypothetical protein
MDNLELMLNNLPFNNLIMHFKDLKLKILLIFKKLEELLNIFNEFVYYYINVLLWIYIYDYLREVYVFFCFFSKNIFILKI